MQIALGKRLSKTTIGDPSLEGVRMGSLAGIEQREEVVEKVKQLAITQDIVFGSLEDLEEVVGNIIENACKYGKKKINVEIKIGNDADLTIIDNDISIYFLKIITTYLRILSDDMFADATDCDRFSISSNALFKKSSTL